MVQISKLVDEIDWRRDNKYGLAYQLIDFDDLEILANKEDNNKTLRNTNVNTKPPQLDYVILLNLEPV